MTDPGGAGPLNGSGRTTPINLARQADFMLGGARVRPSIAEVVAGDTTVRLQRRVMQVLVALAGARGEVVSRDDLIASCWGGLAVGDDAINRCVGRLRRLAEEEAPGAFTIETLPRIGYRLTPSDGAGLALMGTSREPPSASFLSPAARPQTRPWIIAAAGALVAIVVAIVAAPGICTALAAACPLAISAPAPSIAVLPFANLSGDPSQEYFSDGLSDELLSRLSRIPKLQVAARTSSFSFRGDKADSRTIADRLGVNYILDGSVRREGGHIRVSAQLVEAHTGFERWSQTYDRDFKDVFTVQTDIAEAVTEAMKIQLTGADKSALTAAITNNSLAYDDYLRGRSLYGSSTDEAGLRRALALFDAALAADPEMADAHVARASTLLLLANQYLSADQLKTTYNAAIASARRAVELAPDLPETQATLADALAYGSHDFAGAKLAYERALLAGGAGDAKVLLGYGAFQCSNGDAQEGLIALRRAVVLDPLNPLAFRALGLGFLYGRQYQQAQDAMRRALELKPGLPGAYAGIGEALLLMGKPADAEAQYALEPQTWQRLTGQAIALHRLGRTAEAQAAVKALIALGGDSGSYQLAQIHAQWGEPDAAFAALDTAFNIGDSGVEALAVDPLMDPLRKDPRFAQRLARAGLVR